ncbi:hypothetical protein GCM10010390_91310 [Streptomyces mordarskii]|uniref:Secreted protein n=2 Tax=Streptomyces mordarskii TaxID=1226758 RepID=A0ABN1ETF0_9ACTN
MSDWSVALIAAGSAVAGSLVTGWFTRSAGYRQAEAARHAGNRQADAMIATVQATVDEQRSARLSGQRRQAYVQFLQAAETVRAGHEAADNPGGGPGPSEADTAALQYALATVKLESAAEAAAGYRINEVAERFATLARHYDVHAYRDARQAFLDEAHAAILRIAQRGPAPL